MLNYMAIWQARNKIIYCGVGVSSVSASFGVSRSLSRQITPFYIIIVKNVNVNIKILYSLSIYLPCYRNISFFWIVWSYYYKFQIPHWFDCFYIVWLPWFKLLKRMYWECLLVEEVWPSIIHPANSRVPTALCSDWLHRQVVGLARVARVSASDPLDRRQTNTKRAYSGKIVLNSIKLLILMILIILFLCFQLAEHLILKIVFIVV